MCLCPQEIVGNITAELKAKAMWERTFLVWSSDNGGAVHLHGGANSYPLRGGYMNNWEGGIRVAALVNGGFLPADVRGNTLTDFIHECGEPERVSTLCRRAFLVSH